MNIIKELETENDGIDKKIAEYNSAIRALKDRRRMNEIKLAKELFNVEYRSVVVDAHEEEYLVESIDRLTKIGGMYQKPWLTGRKKKKDGSWGERVFNIYGKWELKK